jgi:hypothetical protein
MKVEAGNRSILLPGREHHLQGWKPQTAKEKTQHATIEGLMLKEGHETKECPCRRPQVYVADAMTRVTTGHNQLIINVGSGPHGCIRK